MDLQMMLTTREDLVGGLTSIYKKKNGQHQKYMGVLETDGHTSMEGKCSNGISALRRNILISFSVYRKNQIIWGGNYFELPPTRCFIVWDKKQPENFSMAMCEYAWTSFKGNAKIFRFRPQGNGKNRFHPTQKPIELYRWIYANYAKTGYRILDTHLGSGSSRLAAYDMKLDFTGYEINERYFQLQEERYNDYITQIDMGIGLDMIQTKLEE